MSRPTIIGAVLYDPKVSVIWEIIGDFFEERGVPIDVVFFTNYEMQVSALLQGLVDVAWNSPLAWLDAQRRSGDRCRAIAMRDTDRDRTSHIVVRRGGSVRTLGDLRGRTLATGAVDSPQATLIPLGHVRRAGLTPGRDLDVLRFDLLVGKHGDHVGGEREAFRALETGRADACAMLDLNWSTWAGDGTLDPAQFEILTSTDPFDHCVFTVRGDFPEETERRWLDVLHAMSYDDPAHREMMDLEGLKAWLPGRTSGFGPLARAVESEAFFDGAR